MKLYWIVNLLPERVKEYLGGKIVDRTFLSQAEQQKIAAANDQAAATWGNR